MTPPLALTMGDPAGIGGDIALAAWTQRKTFDLPPFFLIDDPARLGALAKRLQLDVPLQSIASPSEALACFGKRLPILPIALTDAPKPGQPSKENAAATIQSIREAVRLVQDGSTSAVVTNPISKAVLYAAGFKHPGHTEFLADLAGGVKPVMMLAVPELRVVPVTIHVSLRDAIASLTTDEIVETAVIAAAGLKRDLAIANPRLAIAGLNPHAGEDGAMGREDIEIVAPAVERLKAMGIDARGPLPPDTMFHAAARKTYDLAICMYHDQALIPLKTLDFEHGVNVTLGLPFIRTSPDHGTAFGIAGTGQANPASLIAALKLAWQMAQSRA